MDTLFVNIENVSSDFGSDKLKNLEMVQGLANLFEIPVKKIVITLTAPSVYRIREDGRKVTSSPVRIEAVFDSPKSLPGEIVEFAQKTAKVLSPFLTEEYPCTLSLESGGRTSRIVRLE